MASQYFKPIIILTAIVTLAQSIVWFIFSLLGVLSYRCEIGPPDQEADSKFIQLLYLYFTSSECGANIILPGSVHLKDLSQVSPTYINGWMCTYLALNITYFLIGIDLCVGICRYKNEGFPVRVLRLWSLNTLAFLVMDFWFTIIWGLEYKSFTDFIANNPGAALDWTSSIPGTLLAITARGFILYFVNLILFIYLARFAYQWNVLGRCCNQIQQGTSQQQLHYPGHQRDIRRRSSYPHDSIPRVNPHAYDNYSRSGPITHPNAVEGVTPFNDWEGNDNFQNGGGYRDTRSIGRSRPASPPRRAEEIFQGIGRPSVRSTFDYPNPRNFERGGKGDSKFAPTKAYGKSNDAFY